MLAGFCNGQIWLRGLALNLLLFESWPGVLRPWTLSQGASRT